MFWNLELQIVRYVRTPPCGIHHQSAAGFDGRNSAELQFVSTGQVSDLPSIEQCRSKIDPAYCQH